MRWAPNPPVKADDCLVDAAYRDAPLPIQDDRQLSGSCAER
jgi:hypothetical protein